MKKILSIFTLLLLSAVVLTACGTTNNNGAGGDAPKESDNLLSKVEEEGELLVGTEGTYPPFTFHDESGKLTGFDVEIAEAIAEKMGVEVKFMETQWDAMFAGLDSKRFDMIANQVGIREDRLEKYDFSDHYITSAAVLVAKEDNDEINSFEDIEGKKSAQSLTSNYADIAREYKAEIEGVEGFNQAVELINSNRVDVTINDKLSVLDFQKNRPNAQIKIVDEAGDAAQSGMMFRKGSDELVDAVNKALAEIIEDGTYEEISEKWFGENVLN
ncbi:amino acid ABC transporter substrate-binding protein [Sutcliffiella horikoshii]|uniref:amino acid ABC transporter substrate-binding protein n=1 Tax=Sutcliffiella horikoshii TaxID=79883 RepID=UPI003CEC1DA2